MGVIRIWKKLNLWPRLVIVVTFGFAVLFGLFSLLALQAVNDSTKHLLQERLVMAQMAAREIDRLLERAFYELEKATKFAPFDPLAPSLAEEFHMLAHAYGRVGTLSAGVYFLDAAGKVVISEPPGKLTPGTDLSKEPHIQEVMQTRWRDVSPPFLEPVTGTPVVALTIPILNPDGSLRSMLSGLIDVSGLDILGPLRHAKDLGRTAHAELVDASGLIIASTGSGGFLQVGEHPEFYHRMFQAGTSGVENVVYIPWHPIPKEREDEQHVMAFTPLSLAAWGVTVGGVDWETFAPVVRLRNTLLLGSGLSLALLWVVALLGARVMVRPVLALTQAAREMALGNLDRSAKIDEGGEIGVLGESLDAMRSQMKDSLERIRRWGEDLEVMVQERTADLSTSNRRLAAVTAVATAANEAGSLHTILDHCLEAVLKHISMDAGAVRLVDLMAGQMVAEVARGSYTGFPCHHGSVEPGECPCGVVASTGKPLYLDPRQRKEFQPACSAPEAQSLAILPLISPKGTIGVLSLFSREGQLPGEEEQETLAAICNQIAVAVESFRLLEELRRLEAQREVERMKAELISAVSHELRTPLGFIKGYCTTLLRQDISIDEVTYREFLQIIDEETVRLQRMIEDLLDVSRLEAGRLPTESRPVGLASMVQGAVSKVRATLEESGHAVALELPVEDALVLADPVRIEQVLDNLLENAALYSGPGTVIKVAVSREDRFAVVSVADHGNGIPESEHERIFEPFYRGSSARRSSVKGTGLGLAICRGIVEAHRGHISVESAPGQGSIFFFTLPLARDASATLTDAKAASDEAKEEAR